MRGLNLIVTIISFYQTLLIFFPVIFMQEMLRYLYCIKGSILHISSEVFVFTFNGKKSIILIESILL